MNDAIFEPADLPELQQAGALVRYTLETPLIPGVFLVLLGVMALLALKSMGRARSGVMSVLLGVLLGTATIVIGTVVKTDREHLLDHTRLLVNAVADGDEQSMEMLMDESITIDTPIAKALGRDRVIELAQSRVQQRVERHTLTDGSADLPGSRVGRTLVKVRVEGEFTPTISWWMIEWMRAEAHADSWTATRIEPIWIQGLGRFY